MSAADKTKLDGISDIVAGITPGIGISASTINGTTTIKTKLKTETAASISSKNSSIVGTQLYSVIADKDGNLAVSVPWTDNNTVYTLATQNTSGLMSAADKIKLDSLYEADGTGTVKSISAGVGLATDSGTAITQQGTIKAKLKSETALSLTAATATATSGRVYAVVPDNEGYLSVVVPWANDNTTYNAMTAAEMKTGTATDSRTMTAANIKSAMTDGIFATGTTNGTFKVYDSEIAIAGLGDVAYINTNSNTAQFLRGDGTWVTPQGTTYSAGSGLNLSGTEFSVQTGGITNAMLAGSIANNKLSNSSISIAGHSVSLGGSIDSSTLTSALGLSSALRFIGITTTSMIDNYNNAVIVDGSAITPSTGDVVIDSDSEYEYVYVNNHWERLGPDGSYKLVQTAVDDPTADGTSTTFIKTISQNAQGVISATKANLPEASTSTKGIIQITSTNTNSFLAQLPTWTANPSDNTYFIRQNTDGSDGFGKVKFSTLYAYIKSKIGITASGDTFLRKDGTWASPENTTYNNATQSAAGLMSAADKIKLDGIAEGAQVGTVTSVTGGAGLSGGTITSSGTLALKLKTTTALQESAGNPTANENKTYPLAIDASGNLAVNIPWTDHTYSAATQSADGLMSSTDKIKLDGITTYSVSGEKGIVATTTNGATTVKAKLKSELELSSDAATPSNVADRTYPVSLDQSGYLAVNVPWENDNTTYNALTTDLIATGTDTANRTVSAKVFKDALDAYVDNINSVVYKGTLGTGGTITAVPSVHEAGQLYRIITAGTYAGKVCEVGDLLLCINDSLTASNDDWTVIQTNLDGVVIGPASSTDAHVAIFDGTTGKLIKDSGFTIGKSVPSDAKFTDTTYVFDGTYNASSNKAATVSTVTNAIDALDGSITGTPGAGKTITAFSQTNGKVTATFGDISVTTSQISDFPTEMTPAAHTHGNITNDGKLGTASRIVVTDSSKNITTGSINPSDLVLTNDSRLSDARTPTSHNHGDITNSGTITASAITVANNDRLVIVDADDNKVVKSSIVFDGSTETQALTKKGTWATFNNYVHPTTSGNKHIPSGGSSGQILRWSADGTAEWGAENNDNTTYTFAEGTVDGAFSVTPSGGSAQTVNIHGLGSNAYTSTAYAPISSPALTGTPTAPTAAAGTNTTQIATTAFVQQAFAANDAMVFKGTIGTGGTVTMLPANHYQGWTYKVITAGEYAGQNCEVGDLIICITDGTTQNDAHWTVAQTNIDGAVTGPSGATDGSIALFNGNTGKVIKSGTVSTETVVKSITFNSGTAPVLGTAISIPNVTDNSDVTASKVTSSDVSVITSVSQAASTSSVIASVTDGVLIFGKAITQVGTVSSTSGTANTVSITDVTASKVTLGNAISVPNVTSVGSVPTLSTTPQTVVTGIS